MTPNSLLCMSFRVAGRRLMHGRAGHKPAPPCWSRLLATVAQPSGLHPAESPDPKTTGGSSASAPGLSIAAESRGYLHHSKCKIRNSRRGGAGGRSDGGRSSSNNKNRNNCNENNSAGARDRTREPPVDTTEAASATVAEDQREQLQPQQQAARRAPTADAGAAAAHPPAAAAAATTGGTIVAPKAAGSAAVDRMRSHRPQQLPSAAGATAAAAAVTVPHQLRRRQVGRPPPVGRPSLDLNRGWSGSLKVAHADGDFDECAESAGSSLARHCGGLGYGGSGRSTCCADAARGIGGHQNRRSGFGGRGRGRLQGAADSSRAPGITNPRVVNQAIVDAGSQRSHQGILQIVEKHGAHFNAVNTATALHRLGSCGLVSRSWDGKQLLADPRFRQLERLAVQHLPSFSGPEVTNCLWALAKLGFKPRAATGYSRRRVISSEDSGGDDGDCNGGGGCGRVHYGATELSLLQGLSSRAGPVLQEFTSQAVAKTLWALGRLGHHPGDTLLIGLTDRLLQLMPQASHQDISNSLLGLAKLGWSPGPHVLDKVTRGSLPKVGDFNAQELSNSLWSLAHLNHCNGQLQAAIFQQALARLSDFNSQNLSNLIWAAATLGLGPNGGGGVDDSGGAGVGDGGSNADNQSARQGLLPEELLRSCCDRTTATLQNFSHQELSNLLWAIAKLGYRHEPLLRAAASQAAKQLAAAAAAEAAENKDEEKEQRQAQDTEDVNGSSSSGEGSGLQGREATRPHHQPWSSQAVANTTWAYATLGFQPGAEYLHQVCLHMSSPRRLSGYKWQEVANTMWALATLQHRDTAALDAVEREVVDRLEAARGQGQRQGEGEEDHLESRTLVPTQPQLRPQHVSNLLWAYASLHQPAPQLFATLLPLLACRLPQFSGQEISNSMWAAARLQVYDGQVMDAVADHVCAHRLQDLKPQEVANIAWAYGGLRHAHRALLDGLVARAVGLMSPSLSAPSSPSPRGRAPRHQVNGTLKVQELASICGAVGVFGWRYPSLFQATAQRLAACVQHHDHVIFSGRAVGSRDVGDTVTTTTDAAAEAAGAAGRQAGELVGRRRQPLLKARDVCNLTWGLSLVGGCSPRVWDQLMELLGRVAEAQGGIQGLPDEELAQVYQAYLYMQLDFPAASLALGPPGLVEEGLQAWRWRSLQGSQVSGFQREVSQALTRLGLGHSVELLTSDGKFSIDLAVEVEIEAGGEAMGCAERHSVQAHQRIKPGVKAQAFQAVGAGGNNTNSSSSSDSSCNDDYKSTTDATDAAKRVIRVAVEADGPWHFTSNTRQPLSTTLYRRRCLEASGWVVVSVPYWRWSECVSSPGQQDAVLADLMREADLEPVLAAAAAAKQAAEAASR